MENIGKKSLSNREIAVKDSIFQLIYTIKTKKYKKR